MKLIITRHGQTEGNVKKILADIDDPLTFKGREQAEKVAEALKHTQIDVIYSSPLVRARETADIISKNHPNVELVTVDELKEMELGSYTNKGYDEVDWDDVLPEGIESKTSMYNRAQIIIERALSKYHKGTVLFVAHNAINKAMIRFLRKWHPEDKRVIHQANTAITIFEISEKECKEILFNDTQHLN